MLKNIENELLYYFASCKFDLTGTYDRYGSNWYVIRDMFSLGQFSKHSTQSMLFVEYFARSGSPGSRIVSAISPCFAPI